MGNGAGPPRACRKRRRRENASRPHHCCTFLHCNLLRFHAEPFSLILEKRPRWRRRSDSPKRAIIIFHQVAVAPDPSVSGRKPDERQFVLGRHLGATGRVGRCLLPSKRNLTRERTAIASKSISETALAC